MTTRKSPRIPKYRLHAPSGLAVVRLNGRDIYLGKHGTKESRQEYGRIIKEWLRTVSMTIPPVATASFQLYHCGAKLSSASVPLVMLTEIVRT